MWNHRILQRAADLDPAPPHLPPTEAQAWSNFIVFTPQRVPDGCTLREGTLRREAPPGRVGEHTAGRTPWSQNNPAAYRFEVAGAGRRLRVKEFLYDWAFPALDHPCLWESNTRAVPIDDRYVLWYGIDYMHHRGASARIARTMIELSVLQGEFNDHELLELYRSLVPADARATEAIGQLPLAALSYWARRPGATPVGVPVGLWQISQSGKARFRWCAGEQARQRAAATLSGLALDSVSEEETGEGAIAGEAVYTGGADRGTELRVQRLRERPATATPEHDDHPGQFAATDFGYLAWIDERYGPFDAVIDGRQRLLSTTGVGLDREWFERAVAELRSTR